MSTASSMAHRVPNSPFVHRDRRTPAYTTETQKNSPAPKNAI